LGYKIEDWKNRLSERSDLSSSIVHLTRKGTAANLVEQLLKILDDKTLIGSTTDSGFIVGKTPAVCFQDAPLHSIAQNIWFEQKYRKQNPSAKVRYYAVGLSFKKDYAYKKGARPVLYEQTEKAKKILPENEWWRIVNFNLSDNNSIIDWTHEREWRCPNDFTFAISEVTILLTNQHMYQLFIKTCEEKGLDIHQKIRGIVVMGEVLF
jgi:hypothetical protein